MLRYSIIFEDTDTLAMNIKSKDEAAEQLKALSAAFESDTLFDIKIDWLSSIQAWILALIQLAYVPIYVLGILILIIARLILALGYVLILQPKTAWNVLKFIARWKGQE